MSQDLEDEFRDHLQRRIEADVAKGLAADEARYATLRALDGVEQRKEECGDMRGTRFVDQCRQDITYACRMLRRSPGFTATVVLILALGVAMNTAVFSVVNAVLLRPLSYPQPDRLVWLATTDPVFKEEIVPRYDFRVWREEAQSFDRMVAYVTADNTIGTTQTAIRTRVARVSHDFWDIARPRVAFGRVPAPDERNVLLLTYRLFEQQFQGNPSIVGSTGMLDGSQITIAGVLQTDFRFELVPPPRRDSDTKEVEAYVSLEPAPQDTARSRGRTVSVVARLKPNITLGQARRELDVIRARIAQNSPIAYLDKMPLQIVSLHERLVGSVRLALWLLLGAVMFVLLIGGCPAGC